MTWEVPCNRSVRPRKWEWERAWAWRTWPGVLYDLLSKWISGLASKNKLKSLVHNLKFKRSLFVLEQSSASFRAWRNVPCVTNFNLIAALQFSSADGSLRNQSSNRFVRLFHDAPRINPRRHTIVSIYVCFLGHFPDAFRTTFHNKSVAQIKTVVTAIL